MPPPPPLACCRLCQMQCCRKSTWKKARYLGVRGRLIDATPAVNQETETCVFIEVQSLKQRSPRVHRNLSALRLSRTAAGCSSTSTSYSISPITIGWWQYSHGRPPPCPAQTVSGWLGTPGTTPAPTRTSSRSTSSRSLIYPSQAATVRLERLRGAYWLRGRRSSEAVTHAQTRPPKFSDREGWRLTRAAAACDASLRGKGSLDPDSLIVVVEGRSLQREQ